MFAISRILRTTDKAWEGMTADAPTTVLQYLLTSTQDKTLNLEMEDFKKMTKRENELKQLLKQRGVSLPTDTKKKEF
jgi:hypothetical protein